MPSPGDDTNRRVFNRPSVVGEYRQMEGLVPAERLLFDRFLRSGMEILDIGVGAGRTTPHLSSIAARYVGIDYAENMVEACRERFPSLDFHVADASDLSRFPAGAFDAAVFSFNGIDYLYPDEKRSRCLEEIHRVLRAGGELILSAHNSRMLGVPWMLEPGEHGLGAAVRVLRDDQSRVLAHLRRGAFWRGHGYVLDPAHGGLTTHVATPKQVYRELRDHGFEVRLTVGSEYPERRSKYFTPWYHHACWRVS